VEVNECAVISKIAKFFLAPLYRFSVETTCMEKMSLSFTALAAIVAMTISEGCVSKGGIAGTQCAKPTLSPPDASSAITSVRIKIATATQGAYLRYTVDGSDPSGGSSGNGTEIAASSGVILVEFGLGPKGRTVKAIGYKDGFADSAVAVGHYVYESPY
jgi:hypothetical protein